MLTVIYSYCPHVFLCFFKWLEISIDLLLSRTYQFIFLNFAIRRLRAHTHVQACFGDVFAEHRTANRTGEIVTTAFTSAHVLVR